MVHIIDVASLAGELPGDKPCGDDLEYDPEFGELQRAAQPKAEQQFGDTVIASQEPDWRQVKDKGLSLLGRTRDLRVGVLLTRALLNTDGFPGLENGLELVETLVKERWEQVHPQLDPDDDNDPVLRVNTLANLCGQDTLGPIRRVNLVSARGLGSYSLHDLQVAKGDAAPHEGEAAPDASAIEAAFLGCDLDELRTCASAVESSLERVQRIESALTERVGHSQSISMDGLTALLGQVREVLSAQLARRGVGEGEAGTQETAGDPHEAAAGPAPGGTVNSREDVVRFLDKICDYYRQREPSSPIPILLERAKRLVSRDFMDIVRDLTPDGVAQAELFRGVVDSSDGSD